MDFRGNRYFSSAADGGITSPGSAGPEGTSRSARRSRDLKPPRPSQEKTRENTHPRHPARRFRSRHRRRPCPRRRQPVSARQLRRQQLRPLTIPDERCCVSGRGNPPPATAPLLKPCHEKVERHHDCEPWRRCAGYARVRQRSPTRRTAMELISYKTQAALRVRTRVGTS